MKKLVTYFSVLMLLFSCYNTRHSSGGGERVSFEAPRKTAVSDIALPKGYKIEVVAQGLTFPTGIAFDEAGTPYVTESGYSYGEVFTEPRLLKITKGGKTEMVAKGGANGPWNGVTFYNGYFYVAEGGQKEGGKILRIDPKGNIKSLVEGLPSYGDHHTNGPAIHDGYIYFGQGTATNSSVVGEDNYNFGWLSRNSEFHDIPCDDITLRGVNYTTKNVLDKKSGEEVKTGAYLPYGTASQPGQVIKGQVPCSGAIMRIPLAGGKPELVAWGMRNPFGLAFDSRGQLYITDNGYDDRGSRPVWGTGDYLWKLEKGKWYGWPDFSGGHALYDSQLKAPGSEKPERILEKHPGEPPHPAATLGVHSSSNGFDFSTSDDFGFKGEAFIAQFGDMAPNVGKVLGPVGFKVVRVNTETGIINDFVLNKKETGPASKLKTYGIERPVAARFSPDGKSLYIVDFGIVLEADKSTKPMQKTGVVWKVTKK